MSYNLNAFIQFTKNDLAPSTEHKIDPQANKLSKGMTVYKKNTGMAFEVVNVSLGNGIKHFNLLCPKTGSRYYLSKFALEKDYAEEKAKVEKFGIRIVKRLSEMWAKQVDRTTDNFVVKQCLSVFCIMNKTLILNTKYG